MMRKREMREHTENLGKADVPGPRGLGPKDSSTSWLQTLKDMIANR